ncbi:MAG: sigma-54-dependent Fis family transcriptional regulator [Oligoflexales bacterium]|nr:sigma-54-dependent Fis family transcriptional regulator [Oligoflexales bacterium]
MVFINNQKTLHHGQVGSSSHLSPSSYLDYIQSRKGKRLEPQRQLFETADEKMKRIHDIIWQIADTNVPVLITGESGVGKEVIAKAIHDAAFSNSEERPYVAINCAAMPPTLLESELFGFEKGAFTGAHQRHIGKFELASNGTLLLDEITEMDLNLQAKFLRVLQEKVIDRIGSMTNVPINTRILATSNRDISKTVAQGKFRQDLYYRLYVIHIEIPPLRERPKDISLLAEKFLAECRQNFGRPGLRFSEEAMQKLLHHNWPGNVRELQNIIQRSVILCSNDLLTKDVIPLDIHNPSQKANQLEWVSHLPLGQTLRLVETNFILETLKSHQGNRTHAAKTLGISLRTLRNKINEFTMEGYEVIGPLTGKPNV